MRTRVGPPRFADCPEAPLLGALASRGYRQGANLDLLQVGPLKLVEWGAGGYQGDFLQPAAYLASLQPDVIVADGEDAARSAKAVTTTVPIVATNVNDLVETGLVTTVARPGGNLTGVSFRTSDLSAKRIELLKDAFPHVRRPILIYGVAASDVAAIGPALAAARQIGLTPIPVQFAPTCGTPTVLTERTVPPGVVFPGGTPTPEGGIAGILVCTTSNAFSGVEANLSAAFTQGADSVVVIARLSTPEPLIVWLASRRFVGKYLPGVFPTREYDGVGAIVMREPSDSAAQVATYVDKILRGADPGDLPIISPSNVEIIVNLKTAQELGLQIAPAALTAATTVIR